MIYKIYNYELNKKQSIRHIFVNGDLWLCVADIEQHCRFTVRYILEGRGQVARFETTQNKRQAFVMCATLISVTKWLDQSIKDYINDQTTKNHIDNYVEKQTERSNYLTMLWGVFNGIKEPEDHNIITRNIKESNEKPTSDKQKEVSFSYAQSVKLFKDQHDSLINKYGEENVNEMIISLHNYKMASGKKYKSDYHAILRWVADKVMNKKKEPEQAPIKKQKDFSFVEYVLKLCQQEISNPIIQEGIEKSLEIISN